MPKPRTGSAAAELRPHKVHYGLVGPVCTGGRLPCRGYGVMHVFTPTPERVTCKVCKSMMDLRDTAHVLHLKKNLKGGKK